MNTLAKQDIVGSKIIDVLQSYSILNGWLNCTHTYFKNDRGHSFSGPSPGYAWTDDPVPPEARTIINDPDIHSIIGHVITGVFAEPDGDPSSVMIQLDNARCISIETVLPEGVGQPGFFIHESSDINFSELKDFWSLIDSSSGQTA